MVLAACFSEMGHTVCGVSDDDGVVQKLNDGEPPLFEPGVSELIRRNVQARRLRFTTDYRSALKGAEFVYISIDTPVNDDDSSDLTGIFAIARNIARALSGPIALVVTAQVPVGTSERIAETIKAENPSAQLGLAYVPEFLRLGTAIETFKNADRFVIGTDEPALLERLSELYRPLGRPLILTSLRSAEMGKHACNAFLASSISFINEIANLCEEIGADAQEVVRIMKADTRIGSRAFLSPGLGFAGGTLGREIRALQKFGAETNHTTPMMDAIWAVNQSRADLVRSKIERYCGGLRGLKVAILGLTYKPGTSTLRRAISLEIIRDLRAHQVAISAHDPLVRREDIQPPSLFELAADPYLAAKDADAVVLLTEWENIVEGLDLARLKALMRGRLFVDTRNLFEPEALRRAGFLYVGIGRANHEL